MWFTIFLWVLTAVVSGSSTSGIFKLSNESLADVEFLSSLAHLQGVSMLADDYNKKYEVVLASEVGTVLEDYVPITSCHDSTSGSGGDISFSISVGISFSESLKGKLAETYLNIFSISASVGVSQGFTVSSSYTCNIPKGARGQIWALAFAEQAQVQHRAIYMDKKGNEVQRGDWSPAYMAKVPADVAPMFSCRTDTYSACKIPVSSIKIQVAKDIPN